MDLKNIDNLYTARKSDVDGVKTILENFDNKVASDAAYATALEQNLDSLDSSVDAIVANADTLLNGLTNKLNSYVQSITQRDDYHSAFDDKYENMSSIVDTGIEDGSGSINVDYSANVSAFFTQINKSTIPGQDTIYKEAIKDYLDNLTSQNFQLRNIELFKEDKSILSTAFINDSGWDSRVETLATHAIVIPMVRALKTLTFGIAIEQKHSDNSVMFIYLTAKTYITPDGDVNMVIYNANEYKSACNLKFKTYKDSENNKLYLWFNSYRPLPFDAVDYNGNLKVTERTKGIDFQVYLSVMDDTHYALNHTESAIEVVPIEEVPEFTMMCDHENTDEYIIDMKKTGFIQLLGINFTGSSSFEHRPDNTYKSFSNYESVDLANVMERQSLGELSLENKKIIDFSKFDLMDYNYTKPWSNTDFFHYLPKAFRNIFIIGEDDTNWYGIIEEDRNLKLTQVGYNEFYDDKTQEYRNWGDYITSKISPNKFFPTSIVEGAVSVYDSSSAETNGIFGTRSLIDTSLSRDKFRMLKLNTLINGHVDDIDYVTDVIINIKVDEVIEPDEETGGENVPETINEENPKRVAYAKHFPGTAHISFIDRLGIVAYNKPNTYEMSLLISSTTELVSINNLIDKTDYEIYSSGYFTDKNSSYIRVLFGQHNLNFYTTTHKVYTVSGFGTDDVSNMKYKTHKDNSNVSKYSPVCIRSTENHSELIDDIEIYDGGCTVFMTDVEFDDRVADVRGVFFKGNFIITKYNDINYGIGGEIIRRNTDMYMMRNPLGTTAALSSSNHDIAKRFMDNTSANLFPRITARSMSERLPDLYYNDNVIHNTQPEIDVMRRVLRSFDTNDLNGKIFVSTTQAYTRGVDEYKELSDYVWYNDLSYSENSGGVFINYRASVALSRLNNMSFDYYSIAMNKRGLIHDFGYTATVDSDYQNPNVISSTKYIGNNKILVTKISEPGIHISYNDGLTFSYYGIGVYSNMNKNNHDIKYDKIWNRAYYSESISKDNETLTGIMVVDDIDDKDFIPNRFVKISKINGRLEIIESAIASIDRMPVNAHTASQLNDFAMYTFGYLKDGIYSDPIRNTISACRYDEGLEFSMSKGGLEDNLRDTHVRRKIWIDDFMIATTSDGSFVKEHGDTEYSEFSSIPMIESIVKPSDDKYMISFKSGKGFDKIDLPTTIKNTSDEDVEVQHNFKKDDKFMDGTFVSSTNKHKETVYVDFGASGGVVGKVNYNEIMEGSNEKLLNLPWDTNSLVAKTILEDMLETDGSILKTFDALYRESLDDDFVNKIVYPEISETFRDVYPNREFLLVKNGKRQIESMTINFIKHKICYDIDKVMGIPEEVENEQTDPIEPLVVDIDIINGDWKLPDTVYGNLSVTSAKLESYPDTSIKLVITVAENNYDHIAVLTTFVFDNQQTITNAIFDAETNILAFLSDDVVITEVVPEEGDTEPISNLEIPEYKYFDFGEEEPLVYNTKLYDAEMIFSIVVKDSSLMVNITLEDDPTIIKAIIPIKIGNTLVNISNITEEDFANVNIKDFRFDGDASKISYMRPNDESNTVFTTDEIDVSKLLELEYSPYANLIVDHEEACEMISNFRDIFVKVNDNGKFVVTDLTDESKMLVGDVRNNTCFEVSADKLVRLDINNNDLIVAIFEDSNLKIININDILESEIKVLAGELSEEGVSPLYFDKGEISDPNVYDVAINDKDIFVINTQYKSITYGCLEYNPHRDAYDVYTIRRTNDQLGIDTRVNSRVCLNNNNEVILFDCDIAFIIDIDPKARIKDNTIKCTEGLYFTPSESPNNLDSWLYSVVGVSRMRVLEPVAPEVTPSDDGSPIVPPQFQPTWADDDNVYVVTKDEEDYSPYYVMIRPIIKATNDAHISSEYVEMILTDSMKVIEPEPADLPLFGHMSPVKRFVSISTSNTGRSFNIAGKHYAYGANCVSLVTVNNSVDKPRLHDDESTIPFLIHFSINSFLYYDKVWNRTILFLDDKYIVFDENGGVVSEFILPRQSNNRPFLDYNFHTFSYDKDVTTFRRTIGTDNVGRFILSQDGVIYDIADDWSSITKRHDTQTIYPTCILKNSITQNVDYFENNTNKAYDENPDRMFNLTRLANTKIEIKTDIRGIVSKVNKYIDLVRKTSTSDFPIRIDITCSKHIGNEDRYIKFVETGICRKDSSSPDTIFRYFTQERYSEDWITNHDIATRGKYLARFNMEDSTILKWFIDDKDIKLVEESTYPMGSLVDLNFAEDVRIDVKVNIYPTEACGITEHKYRIPRNNEFAPDDGIGIAIYADVEVDKQLNSYKDYIQSWDPTIESLL